MEKTSIKSKVRSPKQERSRSTHDTILESAFHILEEEGLPGLKVATLAERAGYGVGTLYQYFPNMDAVMLALVKAQGERQQQILLARFSDLAAKGQAQSTRDLIELLMGAMDRRLGAQKALLDWVLSRPNVRELEGRNTILAQVLASVSIRSQGLVFTRLLNTTEMFVLSRSVLMTVRSAIWSGSPIFGTPQFEQSLTDLVDGYMYQLARREGQEKSKAVGEWLT